MEARSFFCVALLFVLSTNLSGAEYETRNFVIQNAPTKELARRFGETAERCREELALLWLGKPMPNWSEKCPITVQVGDKLGPGGSTTFIFQSGEVYGWEMDIQGSAERILDSVLPHEITHMILASRFRRPMPRWLDEGAATSVEHESEKSNYRRMIRHFLQRDVRQCLPFNRMVSLKEYPSEVMPFYSQGFSVVEYLILLGGHHRLIAFAEAGMQTNDWNLALRDHYAIDGLGTLQEEYWVPWVAAGSPQRLPEHLQPTAVASTASTNDPRFRVPSSIAPVSAASSPRYGRSAVIPIPATLKNDTTRTVSIPSSYEIPAESTTPSSLDHWVGVEQTVSRPDGAVLFDSTSTRPVYR